ncbi:MAG: caspase family protein [Candidatus Marinimicrobia bacterium]|nr:caspase family protein [Candidatus Neomarinimicrobiota bacterium]
MTKTFYSSNYHSSKALIIGIDDYQHTKKLDNAVNDAKALKDILVQNFLFDEEDVCLLLDGDATKEKIEASFMDFSKVSIDLDDRILFFFAGHGHTLSGRGGDTGFLMPVDADISKRASMIRWDYFTRSSTLIRAKHMLFIIDACYGGTALSRSVSSGSHRLMGDMISRLSYQILTSGKADESVSDGNGPRDGHSLFMGHLLDGLEGRATLTNSNVMTAQSLMSYMYSKVGADAFSDQTPHYGHLEGDGDFIFNPSQNAEGQDEPQVEGQQSLIQYPIDQDYSKESQLISQEKLNRLIVDPVNRIELEGHIDKMLRDYILEIESSQFDPSIEPNDDLINLRVSRCHAIVKPLCTVGVLISKWADTDYQFYLLQKIIKRISDPAINPTPGGYTIWSSLKWYPITIFYYSSGISALSVNNFKVLKSILEAQIPVFNYSDLEEPAFVQQLEQMNEIWESVFKRLPDRERQFVPMSELLFDQLQSVLDELLFLGSDYEKLFDLFEVLTSFYYAYHTKDPSGDIWVSPGRYAYKHNGHFSEHNPLDNFIKDVGKVNEDWIGFKSKLFPGTTTTFDRYAAKIKEHMKRLPIH